MATVIILTTGTTWTVPSDWNNSNYLIETTGGGAGGGSFNFSSNGSTGGGGGAYNFIDNTSGVTFVPLALVPIQIGASGAGETAAAAAKVGGDTWLGALTLALSNVGSKGGGIGGSTAGGVGGAAASGKGSGFNGGNGGTSNTSNAGSGGGGAGGIDGAGLTGGNGASGGTNGGAGGAGDNGVAGGAGGIGGTTGSHNGGAGTADQDGGGGGGGGFGNGGNGGAAGAPGGGGGGGGSNGASTLGGAGGLGQIRITYTPAGGTTGTMASTEDNDTMSGNGAEGFSGTMAATEGSDTFVGTGDAGVTGDMYSMLQDFSTLSIGSDTFARSSPADYYASTGLLTIATSNTPRFDYDPASLVFKGLLIERSSTNIQPQSNFASGWNTGQATLVGSAAISPDGTMNASSITNNNVNSAHSLFGVAIPFVLGQSYAVSFFAKYSTHQFVQYFANASVFPGYANFDLINGTVTASSGTTFTSIQNVGNGWFRCSLGFVSLITSMQANGLQMIPAGNSTRGPSYAGTGTTFYVYGFDCETGTSVTSYNPTTTSAVPRSADQLSFTIPANLQGLTFVFDDGSKQSVAVTPGASYTVPTNLNRPWISKIIGGVIEDNDAMSASGTSLAPTTGTMSSTESADTMSATGTEQFRGTMASTEAADAMAATGKETITGTMAATEAGDTFHASGSAGAAFGSMASTEGKDTMSASGTMQLNFFGIFRAIESGDVCASFGFAVLISCLKLADMLYMHAVCADELSGGAFIADEPPYGVDISDALAMICVPADELAFSCNLLLRCC